MQQTRFKFPKSHRLGGNQAFAAVFDAQVSRANGPLRVFALPNELGHVRLGISISRRVGIAVRRNRIKRLIREAFRLTQQDWQVAYDLVVVVRPHEPLTMVEYQSLLSELVQKLHLLWQKLQAKPN